MKTSTRPTRLVWLRGSQTLRDADPGLTYLSVYSPLDDAGMNLQDLSAQVRDSLMPSVRNLFDEKLAFYDISDCRKRFDFQRAAKSFRFISSSDVPIPHAEDPRILEIRWKCSFETLPAMGDSSVWI